MRKAFSYGEDFLTVSKLLRIATGKLKAELSKDTIQKIKQSQSSVQKIVDTGKTVYGINTGFGKLCTSIISASQTKELQRNLLLSHSVGIGNPIPLKIAKLMLILKVHALAKGYSGISLGTIERIIWHIENDIIPLVPEKGSLGASGDLAPLSHLFLPLIGLGEAWYDGKFTAADTILASHNIKPLDLGAKEGLALINGTQFMAAHGAEILERSQNCLDSADIIGAMSLEGMLGSTQPFDKELHSLRPYDGNQYVAYRLTKLLEGSEMVSSHKDCNRVQDPYSFRCMPQVHGASRNAWLHFKNILETEINSVTDNPIIFSSEKTISGGHFHGQPIALPLDYMGLAMSEMGNISDRRTYFLLDGEVDGLPVLLMKDTGINSGFMIPQYASAALVSENKSKCFPASADSIPTSLGQEDHVSMGAISARKTLEIINNVEDILSIELLCAAQAFDFRKPLKSGKILDACHELVREKVDHADHDRFFADDIKVCQQLIKTFKLKETADTIARKEKIDIAGTFKDLFSY